MGLGCGYIGFKRDYVGLRWGSGMGLADLKWGVFYGSLERCLVLFSFG